MYFQGQSYSPEKATIESPSQIFSASSYPELVKLSAEQVRCLLLLTEERQVYARWSNNKETMLLRLWAENFDRRFFKLCKVSSMTYGIFSPSAALLVESKSLLSGCGFKFSVFFLPVKLKTLPKCDTYLTGYNKFIKIYY